MTHSYVVPNIPSIELINHTSTWISLHPCTDFILYRYSQRLSDFPELFCSSVYIPSWVTKILPLGELYQVFSHPGDYIIERITASWSQKIPPVTFVQEEQGMMRSFLSTVFYAPVYNIFYALLAYLPWHNLGWAIILLTFVIRLILLVPQHQMLVSQKKMQVIQPKIKEIQEKNKWDQAKIGMEMLELYKKEGVNPMGSCLPLLIQMPILIWLYWIITSVTDPANYYYIYSFVLQSWFHFGLIDQLFYWINLQQIGWKTGIIFALLVASAQYLQARLSFAYTWEGKGNKNEKKIIEKNEKGEFVSNWVQDFLPDPDMMKNMMLYFFPLMIAVTTFFFPMWVGVYWFIGTVFVIIQQWVVNIIFKK